MRLPLALAAALIASPASARVRDPDAGPDRPAPLLEISHVFNVNTAGYDSAPPQGKRFVEVQGAVANAGPIASLPISYIAVVPASFNADDPAQAGTLNALRPDLLPPGVSLLFDHLDHIAEAAAQAEPLPDYQKAAALASEGGGLGLLIQKGADGSVELRYDYLSHLDPSVGGTAYMTERNFALDGNNPLLLPKYQQNVLPPWPFLLSQVGADGQWGEPPQPPSSAPASPSSYTCSYQHCPSYFKDPQGWSSCQSYNYDCCQKSKKSFCFPYNPLQ